VSRIAPCFEALRAAGRKALIPYLTAGDPNPALTVPLLHALVAAGADIVELGVPFSDPMADGPVIQRASERALAHGVTLASVIDMVREFRSEDRATPVVLMGYANPIEAMGLARFVAAAQAAGVDGVLVVDYPPEECGSYVEALRGAGIDPVFLLAPTTREARLRRIAQAGSGYLYYVSLRGVTGAAHLDLDEVERRLPLVRAVSALPIGVGFGIRDAASAARAARFADAVVIGSRLIEELERSEPARAAERLQAFLRPIRAALDARAREAVP